MATEASDFDVMLNDRPNKQGKSDKILEWMYHVFCRVLWNVCELISSGHFSALSCMNSIVPNFISNSHRDAVCFDTTWVQQHSNILYKLSAIHFKRKILFWFILLLLVLIRLLPMCGAAEMIDHDNHDYVSHFWGVIIFLFFCNYLSIFSNKVILKHF